MANEDKKISQLPLITDVSGTEETVVVKDGSNGRMATGSIVAKARQGLVEQVTGKGLSTNDYTDTDKAAVATIGNKVDKITGKGLSTNDYTDEDKTKLGALPTKTELDASMGEKLDKRVWDNEHEQFNYIGFYALSNGILVTNSLYRNSGFLPLNRKWAIKILASTASTAAALCFYDVLRKFIQSYQYSIKDGEVIIEPSAFPKNAVWFTVSTMDTHVDESYYSNGPTQESREGAVSEAIMATEKSIRDDFEVRIDELELSKGNYCVGEWDPDILAPEAQTMYGDKSLMAKKVFVLADTSVATDGEPVRAAKELNRLNFHRYKDGSYAPSVVISAEMKAECDGALYLDAAGTQQYCAAGAFDPVTFYENKPWGTKLYKADGTEVSHILRPWETTETKYTIGGGFGFNTYLLDQKKGKSGKIWKGIFTRPATWDGIDVDTPLPPTMFSLSPYTTFGNQARCIFALTADNNNCKSGAAINNLHSAFVDGRAYPRVNDVTAISAMTHCRAMNATDSPTYPYAEGGYLTLNTLISSLELLNGTKDLTTIYGSGISSNDACNSETTWAQNGGVKYRVKGTGTWKYGKIGDAAQGIFKDNTGATSYWYQLTNNEYPKEHCMEAQMAFSFARERNIPENTEFDYYGYTYRYKRLPHMSADRMDAVVYRVVSAEFGAYDAQGSAITVEMQVNLRMSVYDGFTWSGDVFKYCQGGYEQVLDIDHDSNADHTNFPMKIYVEPDQRKWHSETAYVKTTGRFDFESVYSFIWEGLTIGNSYCRNRISDTPESKMAGGTLHTGECFYDYGYWYSSGVSDIGKIFRRGARFGGLALAGHCSPRHVLGYDTVALASRHNACFAQFVLSARALQAQKSTPQA